jgi:hypothetical protein
LTARDEDNITGEKWKFSFTWGGTLGGPCKVMDEKLLHYGIGMKWIPETRNSYAFSAETEYLLTKSLYVGLIFTNAHKELFNKLINTNGDSYKNFEFGTKSITSIISFKYRNHIFIGAGPALNIFSYYHPNYNAPFYDANDFVKFGFAVKSSIMYPAKKRLYMKLDMLFNFGSKIDPVYTLVGSGFSQFATRSVRLKDFPVQYFYIGAGLGFKLP